MKLLSLCSATALLLLASLGSSPAQSLLKDAVLSGKIYSQESNVVIISSAQPRGQAASKIVSTPLTIRALLDYFGYPDVKPNTVGLFIDSQIITVAKKDGGFVYGTLFRPSETGYVRMQDKSRELAASAASLLSETLTGEGLITSKPMGKNKLAVKYSFTGHGAVGSTPFIIKGTVSFSENQLR